MTLPSPRETLLALRDQTPLVHCITNYVAMNSTANLLLAAGASPAMLHAQEEVAEFTAIAGALSINIGTLSAPWAEAMQLAAHSAQAHAVPWVLDPVAVGATRLRQQTCLSLLAYQPSVIRANASEIMALSGLAHQGRGVDATVSTDDATQAAITLARRYQCVVAMTGATDIVTDGQSLYRLTGGHPLMPRITTLGCGLSALVAGFVAANRHAPLAATLGALTYFNLAGSHAGQQAEGPGSFHVTLLDTLYSLTADDLPAPPHSETLHVG